MKRNLVTKKRRYSKQYALWKKITGQVSEGDIIKSLRDEGFLYRRGARFVVTAFDGKRAIAVRYCYPYSISKRDLKVVGYVEGYEKKKA